MPKKRSKDEIIQEITEYMEKYPNTNRKKITIACSINGAKLSELEKLGLIKLPKKIKPGANSGWRSFKE
jgi:predicted transcriptional regulator